MKTTIHFLEYLVNKGFSFKTCKRHESIALTFEAWLVAEEVTIKEVDYTVMMSYVYYEKQQGIKTRTIAQKLTAIRHYYDYLGLGINPAQLVKLQADTKQMPHRLLGKEELDHVYSLCPSYGLIKRRDKVLLSLVVYQGVSSSELSLIEVTDLNLMQGTIYIPAIRTTNSRTLQLQPFQLLLIQDYVLKVRPEILRQANKTSEKLLVSTGQSENQLHNVISGILKRLRPQYPRLKDFQQIRQSVITLWVKQYGVRKAQYMAGHRYVSSTERYNEDARESLKNALKIRHPLDT